LKTGSARQKLSERKRCGGGVYGESAEIHAASSSGSAP
jgi:hypothetical protein